MKKIRIITAIALTGLFMTTAANAASLKTANDDLQAGMWALQFSVGDDFTLSSFAGSTISAKYQMNESAALRIGISASLSANDSDGNASAYPDDRSIETESERNTSRFSVLVAYQRYLKRSGAARPYLAVGPYANYRHSKMTDWSKRPSVGSLEDTSIVTHLNIREDDRFQFGVTAILGAEIFVYKGVSLSAEYSISVGHASGENSTMQEDYLSRADMTRVETNTSKDKTSGFILSEGSVKLGVSVYF